MCTGSHRYLVLDELLDISKQICTKLNLLTYMFCFLVESVCPYFLSNVFFNQILPAAGKAEEALVLLKSNTSVELS